MNVQISVIGASNPPPQAVLAAEGVGRGLAQKGAILVTALHDTNKSGDRFFRRVAI